MSGEVSHSALPNFDSLGAPHVEEECKSPVLLAQHICSGLRATKKLGAES